MSKSSMVIRTAPSSRRCKDTRCSGRLGKFVSARNAANRARAKGNDRSLQKSRTTSLSSCFLLPVIVRRGFGAHPSAEKAYHPGTMRPAFCCGRFRRRTCGFRCVAHVRYRLRYHRRLRTSIVSRNWTVARDGCGSREFFRDLFFLFHSDLSLLGFPIISLVDIV